ncbi:hypothetical protein KS4_05300 [Poriferisphaera corsica]|uniref:SbsA Ig-like domain-containing protein n=1 Tax=Poriferisphaera corsica TaxID=2528020 RepID=A0A517YQJ5_9BACT|nr:Ig-like domain-containing protein [Poriferisphaera corsica]QDU32498.1 hypothetical protein KS4_05300 [Poriferisphaera corsica]
MRIGFRWMLSLMMVLGVMASTWAAAPRVVSTTPKAGDQHVDPNLKEIVIKFNVPMGRGRSMTGGGETFPFIDGKLTWRDNKTFVVPVKLLPGKEYYFGVNSPSHRNFKSKDGVSVKWTKVRFKTREAKSGEQVNTVEDVKVPELPKVVSMTPRNGDMNVDPSLKEIVIKFNVPMGKGRSFTGGGETFPPSAGKIYWKDDKTFVRPVKLEPNKKYYFGVNSPSHRNFKSADGVSVPWTKVNFRTGKARDGVEQVESGQYEQGDVSTGVPKIVSITPRNGARGVDPMTDEIVVVFDQPMGKGFAFPKFGDDAPKGVERPVWRDEKTIVWKVKLEPSKGYRFGVNWKQFNSFRNEDGVPVKDTMVRFWTGREKRGDDGKQSKVKKANAPKIVSMSPSNGEIDVDPATDEIVIVFDQPMSSGYSFPQFGDDAPEGVDRPVWRDEKTIVWKVKLEAGKGYRFGVNWGKFNSFKNKEGVPVKDTKVRFWTAKK